MVVGTARLWKQSPPTAREQSSGILQGQAEQDGRRALGSMEKVILQAKSTGDTVQLPFPYTKILFPLFKY